VNVGEKLGRRKKEREHAVADRTGREGWAGGGWGGSKVGKRWEVGKG